MRVIQVEQLGFPAEAGQRLEDLDEGVLDQILDVAVGTEDPVERPVHPGALLAEQLALGRRVAGHAPAGQVEIAHGLGGVDRLAGCSHHWIPRLFISCT